MEERSELHRAFLEEEWRAVSQPESSDCPTFDGLFDGGFAVCAVVLETNASGSIEAWLGYQAALAAMKAAEELPAGRDLYLVFLLERVSEAAIPTLQDALDDTLVCRKICLETAGRSLSDTLHDIPFFPTSEYRATIERRGLEPDENEPRLPGTLNHDLERRSPEVIFQNILERKYQDPSP